MMEIGADLNKHQYASTIVNNKKIQQSDDIVYKNALSHARESSQSGVR